MKKLLTALLLSIILFGCATKEPAKSPNTIAAEPNTFTNPIYPNGADPWLEYFDGNYYLTTTTWTSQLVMRKSPTLQGLATATPIHIWSESDLGRCCNFWAFEFHRLKTEKGYRWYVMYTSGIAENFDRQHLSVIESQGDDPLGPYTYKGSPMPDTWNIDGNYFEHKGQLYLLWSEWIKDEQSILIAKMTNPWTITGEKVVIARPHYEWEKSGMKVNEGPEMLIRNGKTYMVYSASFCNTPDYKLGLMELVGEDPLKPESWHKFDKPVFSKANGVFGPGHNGFFKSPDGTEDWLIYHGNASELEGCSSTRSLRAQKFTWNDDGTPNFGEPIAAGEKVTSPAGESGPLITKVQGTQVQLVSKVNHQCVADANGNVSSADCNNETASSWVLDYTTNGNYRLVNAAGLFLGQGGEQCAASATADFNIAPWHNQLCQQWQLVPHDKGWLTLVNAQTKQELQFADCKEPLPVATGKKSVEDVPQFIAQKSACALWRLQPLHELAITSVQSGKAVTAVATKAAANIEQDEWHNKANQRWIFVSTQDGYYQIQSSVDSTLCVAIANKSIVPGSNAELAACGDIHTQWQVDFSPGGTVKLANRKSNLVLDLAHCGLANHTNFAQGQWLESNCQKFQLKPIH